MGIIENFETMLARGQDSALLRFGLGSEYLNQGKFSEAISHLQAAITQNPDYSAAYKLLGKAQTEGDDLNSAIQTYETGITKAQGSGDKQAAKEMQVFLKRLKKKSAENSSG